MEQFSGERKEKDPDRNLRLYPMVTIEAIAEVEGPAWLEQQERIQKGTVSEGEYTTSLSNALERAQQGKESIIYGKGGIDRWQVKKDGTVAFLESYAESLEHVAKARELGFEIVP